MMRLEALVPAASLKSPDLPRVLANKRASKLQLVRNVRSRGIAG